MTIDLYTGSDRCRAASSLNLLRFISTAGRGGAGGRWRTGRRAVARRQPVVFGENIVAVLAEIDRFRPLCRAGDFVTLADVVSEVGKDVVRFMMLTKRADTPLDFDFMKVVEASKDNPVFYVQYAHARISSLKRKAADAGVDLGAHADLSLLDEEELALVKRAAKKGLGGQI